MDGDPRDALGRQADICRRIGSPFTAGVLDAAARVLDDGSATGRTILRWEGDPDRAALALRLAGGPHALARRGSVPRLTELATAHPHADWIDWTG